MATNVVSDIDLQIGKTIRARREKTGLTQADLGRAIGVTFQQVQKYERGTNRVSAAAMMRVADALKCSVADLYDDPDPAGHSSSERAILKLWAQLEERQQDTVIEMIRAFKKL